MFSPAVWIKYSTYSKLYNYEVYYKRATQQKDYNNWFVTYKETKTYLGVKKE